MDGTLRWLLGLGGLAALGYLVDRWLVWRGARRLRGSMQGVYDTDWVETDPRDHPDLDLAFYDRCQGAFEALGFTKLADVELLNSTRAFPRSRTFVRSLIGEDGTFMAALYHYKLRGLVAPLIRLLGVPTNLRIYEVETEMDDGHFLTTSVATMAGTVKVHPHIHREFIAPETCDEASLVARHRERVAEYRRAHPEVQPLVMTTTEDVRAAGERMDALKKAFREGLGGALTREELHDIGGPARAREADRIADEMDRQEAEGRPPKL